MTTVLTANGLLEIPEEFRKADSLQAGQSCDIERVSKGEYRLHVTPVNKLKPKERLIDVLRSCPVKGFYTPLERVETTDDLPPLSFE